MEDGAKKREEESRRLEYEKENQEKDSDDVSTDRVELLKTITDEEDKLLIYGYIRENALDLNKLNIPKEIIDYVVLYRYYLPQWERKQYEKERAEERERKRIIDARNKEIDDRVAIKTKGLMQRIEELTQKVEQTKKLMINRQHNNRCILKMNGDKDDVEAVKLWLKEKLGLMEYVDLFIDNGFDKLSVVVLLDKSTLKEMGIDKIGHQLLILDEIRKLKRL